MIRVVIYLIVCSLSLFSLNLNSKELQEYQNLITFIKQDNLSSFQKQLQGKNPNVYNIYTPTLLEISSKLDRLEFIKVLDQKGINLTLKTKIKQESMAHVALDNHSYKSADYLIKKIHDINTQDIDGDTLLHLAVKNSANNIINLLLSKGIDKTIKNRFGKTAYDMAKDNMAIDILVLPKLNTKPRKNQNGSKIVEKLENNKIQNRLQSSSINERLKSTKINDRLKSSKINNIRAKEYIKQGVYIGE